ncbi:MAG: glycoside hydrolase family 3 protein [Candidatus Krumholzibacteria bacterium]|nr:glycoside hydrolase family 3 protein [Candidatus Krumholzibacteria bacterium]
MINDIISRLSPLIVVGLEGTVLTDRERELLAAFPPAGVIFFARNVADADQLKGLASEVSDIIMDASGLVPLIMADHEGGRTSVLAQAIGAPPSQMSLLRAESLAGEKGILEEIFRETALRMLSCGINMTLSPVADINSEYLNPIIGTRAFDISADPVCDAVQRAVVALRETGILTSIKHFPGHGSTTGDSHLVLPIVGKTTDELIQSDIEPFRSGIRAGADTVMTAHIAPADRSLPTSLDPFIIGDLLRGQLGFDGAIITDGLEMAGILTGRGLMGAASGLYAGEGCLLKPACVLRTVLEAGNDILLFSRPAAEVYAEIKEMLPLLEDDLDFWHDRFDDISARSRPRVDELRSRAVAAGRSGSDRIWESSDEMYERVSVIVTGAADSVGSVGKPTFDDSTPIVFCGEEKDFSYFTAGSFISTLLAGTGRAEGPVPVTDRGLEPLFEGLSPHSREPMRFFSLSYGSREGKPSGVLVMMGRRPVTVEDLNRLTEGFDTIVVTDWPWVSRFIDTEKKIITTYGICDSAASAVAGLLSGEGA